MARDPPVFSLRKNAHRFEKDRRFYNPPPPPGWPKIDRSPPPLQLGRTRRRPHGDVTYLAFSRFSPNWERDTLGEERRKMEGGREEVYYAVASVFAPRFLRRWTWRFCKRAHGRETYLASPDNIGTRSHAAVGQLLIVLTTQGRVCTSLSRSRFRGEVCVNACENARGADNRRGVYVRRKCKLHADGRAY